MSGLSAILAIVLILFVPPISAAAISVPYFGGATPTGGLFLLGGVAADTRSPTGYTATTSLIEAWGNLTTSAGPGTGAAGVADDLEFDACAALSCAYTFTATKSLYNVSLDVGSSLPVGVLNMSVSCNSAGSSAIAAAGVNVEMDITEVSTGATSGWSGLTILGPISNSTHSHPQVTVNYTGNAYSDSGIWSIYCSGTTGTGYAWSALSPAFGNATWLGKSGTFLGSLSTGQSYLVQFRVVMIAVAQVFNDPHGGTSAAARSLIAGPSYHVQAKTPVTIY